MDNSPTEGEQVLPASNEPTGQEQVQQPAAEQNQETNSREQSQEVVSDDTATQQSAEQQTQQTGGGSTTDDGLAKFAKSQGFDLETATDDVKRALKIAHDNQKAFRERNQGERITDATKTLGGSDVNARIANLEYERQTDHFFGQEGRDRNLEGTMAQVLNEKVQELTPMLGEQQAKAYAYQLSRDLDTLYGMAERKNGASNQQPVDAEQIRREERESINKQLSTATPAAHSTQNTAVTGGEKVTPEWIQSTYDPRNPEHRKMVDEYYSKN